MSVIWRRGSDGTRGHALPMHVKYAFGGFLHFFFTYHVNVLAIFFFISFNADKDVRASNHLKTLMTERSVACGLTHAPWELCCLLLVFPVDLYHRMKAQMLKKMVRCISNYLYTLDYNDDINL